MDHPQNGISLAQNRGNFSSFSSFGIFTQISRILINLVSNWVYRLFQRPILKKRLEELEKLENRPTLNTTGKINIIPYTVLINTFSLFRNKSMHRVGESTSIGSKYYTWQDKKASSIQLMSYIQISFQNGRLRDFTFKPSKINGL